MPRLEGKPAPTNAYVTVGLVGVILLVIALEYLGLINLIPSFGM